MVLMIVQDIYITLTLLTARKFTSTAHHRGNFFRMGQGPETCAEKRVKTLHMVKDTNERTVIRPSFNIQ